VTIKLERLFVLGKAALSNRLAIRPKASGPHGVQSGKRSGLADWANSSSLAQTGKPALRMRSPNCLNSADLDARIDQGQNET
jgi:hypothetical protein